MALRGIQQLELPLWGIETHLSREERDRKNPITTGTDPSGD